MKEYAEAACATSSFYWVDDEQSSHKDPAFAVDEKVSVKVSGNELA